MAKVMGPALSLSASGSIKNKITFQTTPSGHKVYLDRSRAGLITADQSARRTKFLSCAGEWGALSGAEKATWDESAKGLQMSGYNLYIKTCLNRVSVPQADEYLMVADGVYLVKEDGGRIIL